VYKLIIAGIGALAVALLALGCGGGGSDEATAQVSKAEFYKQASRICGKTQKKLLARFQASGKDLSAVYEEAAPLLRQEAEELESLAGPEQVEAKVKPMVANLMKASRLVSQEGKGAVNDPTIETYKQEAAELHLDEC
jgi:fructose-1-phosphate kinase PfkB-like protein